MPHGALNWPSPVPQAPQLSMNSPSVVNFCIRWFPLSAISRLSSASQAMYDGWLICPVADPSSPQVSRTSPVVEKIVTRFRASSVTYSRSRLSKARELGHQNSPTAVPPVPNSPRNSSSHGAHGDPLVGQADGQLRPGPVEDVHDALESRATSTGFWKPRPGWTASRRCGCNGWLRWWSFQGIILSYSSWGPTQYQVMTFPSTTPSTR